MFPASAGMNRCRPFVNDLMFDVPRERGDEPTASAAGLSGI